MSNRHEKVLKRKRIYTTRHYMTKESWKCPYYECKQECSRNWNLKRHIERFHNGIGMPVKHKSKANNAHLQPEIEEMSKMQKYGNNSPPLPYHVNKHSSFYDKRPANEKFSEEQDSWDWFYEAFKKQEDKIEKLNEVRNFLYDHSSLPIYPANPMAHNLGPLPFGGATDFNNSNSIGTFVLPVGFKTHICMFCLTGPIDPVSLSDFKRLGHIAFNSSHTCKQEDIQRLQRVAAKYGIDLINKWDELRLLSLHRLVDIVHLWVGLHRDVYLSAFEVSKSQIEYSMPISLGMISNNHWAYRALDDKGNKKTVIDDTELLYFLDRARATLGLFQAEINGKARYFFCI
jgi:hypothetical protein